MKIDRKFLRDLTRSRSNEELRFRGSNLRWSRRNRDRARRRRSRGNRPTTTRRRDALILGSNDRENRPYVDLLPFRNDDLPKDTVGRRLNLRGDLITFDFEQGLALLNRIANGFQPLTDDSVIH